ncbi:MAG: hypothetical protein J6J65_04760, partial [Opitutales bacterium]|nr:hypothetical protein [Opitutales bacterium]
MSARFFLRRFWRGFAGAEERGGFIFERSDFPNRKFPERRNGILPYRGIRFGKNEVRLGRCPHFCDFRKGKAGLKCPAEARRIVRIVQGAAQAWTHQKTSG